MRLSVLAVLALSVLSGCALSPSALPPVSKPPLARNHAEPADFASADPCKTNYASRREPGYTPPRDMGELWLLCYSHFNVLHSSKTLTPVWSSEHLTHAMARGADAIPRRNTFHADRSPEPFARSTLTDYKGEPWNRGHMTPADDMPDAETQDETFTMANMAPQAPLQNQQLWAALEGSLHVLAETEGELFIVTGPVFSQSPRRLKGRVSIPSAFFKAVLNPASREVTVYFAANRDNAACKVISLGELVSRSGVDAFPTITGASRSEVNVWELPAGHYKPAPDCTP